MQRDELASHLSLLCSSYQRLTGRSLLQQGCSLDELIQRLDDAPFALLSHGTEVDPIFNYGNRLALQLFDMSWDELVSLPSRYSAEQPNREARERLLYEVKTNGFIDHYAGVRIAKNGRRFMIDGATVWNLVDEQGRYHGQAATFSEWRVLNGDEK